MNLWKVKRLSFLVVLIISVVLLYLLLYYKTDVPRPVWPSVSNGSDLLTCYENNGNNNPPSIQLEKVPKNNSFFFIVISYTDDSMWHLNDRQLCSIESAARLNPSSHIYVLVVSLHGDPKRFDEHTNILSPYKNIKYCPLDKTDYFKSTPLEEWYAEGKLKTKWPLHHTADVLRYITLWKYGGIYADLDVMFLKSFEGLSNFAGIESYSRNVIGSCIMSLTLGHPVSDITIKEIRDGFNGSRWGYNGPDVITRALKQHCAVLKVSEMTKDKCHGFTVFPPKKLIPIHWKQADDLFSIEKADSVLDQLNESLAVHFWNYLSYKHPVIIGSEQPYDILADEFCPQVYSN